MAFSFELKLAISSELYGAISAGPEHSSHIEYVLDRMRENTTYVRNIKKYLLAALYNAPATIDSYYAALVNHDLYGSGERR